MGFKFKINSEEVKKKKEMVELERSSHENKGVSIDVGQVLAANQALLKNMARKIENMEIKLQNLESAYTQQTKTLELFQKKTLLLEAPRKEYKAWEPSYPELNENYFSQFSIFERIFQPWKLRRDSVEN